MHSGAYKQRAKELLFGSAIVLQISEMDNDDFRVGCYQTLLFGNPGGLTKGDRKEQYTQRARQEENINDAFHDYLLYCQPTFQCREKAEKTGVIPTT